MFTSLVKNIINSNLNKGDFMTNKSKEIEIPNDSKNISSINISNKEIKKSNDMPIKVNRININININASVNNNHNDRERKLDREWTDIFKYR